MVSDSSPPALPLGPEDIVRYLRHEAKRPLRGKELARALGIDSEPHYARFRELLRTLEREGLVYRQRKGRYAIPEHLNLVVGALHVTRSGDGFVAAGPDREDVFVPAHRLGGAVADDVVVARIERRPRRRNPEGRVIRVLRRAWNQVVGMYHRKRNYGFVKAQEPPLRKDLFIPPEWEGEAEDGQVVVAEVVDWGEGEVNPLGRITRVLGAPGDPGVDVLSILLGHQLPLDFPPEVKHAAATVQARGITLSDLEEREDLRDRLVFTIDPPDAKDHDDALSVRRLEDGRLEVGVHIADVSYYVDESGTLDQEALERATSVYLVDRVVPMLPHALSSDLCSLLPDQDRLTLSVLFTAEPNGRVLESRIARTVIRSANRLSYDEAQGLIEEGRGPDELIDALHLLRKVGRRVRRGRGDRGSIDFDLPEARVVLNAAGEPTDIQRVMRLESHLLIEDLMILANETVARLALREGVPFVFRIHEEPDEEKLDGLRALAATFGYYLPRRKLAPKDLARLVNAMEGTPQEQLISTVTLRSMKLARYATKNAGHFGLASESYAHFTSPIRRYPDLIVHRQLIRWLEAPPRARAVDHHRLEEIASHCSERERKAVEAERESVDLKKIEFMERHLGDQFSGTISGVMAFGLFILLDEYHVEGLAHVSSLEDDYYVYFEEQHALIGQRQQRKFRLGDPVKVRVARVDREAREIDFELLPDR